MHVRASIEGNYSAVVDLALRILVLVLVMNVMGLFTLKYNMESQFINGCVVTGEEPGVPWVVGNRPEPCLDDLGTND